MGRLTQGFILALLLAVFTVSFKIVMFFVLLMGRVFYWLCLYPLYIAFYIELYPLIWIVEGSFNYPLLFFFCALFGSIVALL